METHSPHCLLVVVSVPAEAASIFSATDCPSNKGDHGWPIVAINAHVHLTVSGIGRSNAAAATATAMTLQRQSSRPFDAVVNIGVAGTYDRQRADLGDVVFATDSIFAEEGIALPSGWADVDTLGFPLGQPDWSRGNCIENSPSLRDWIRKLSVSETRTTNLSLVDHNVATVAQCSGTDATAELIYKRTGAIAEAMEGAAVVATARALGVSAIEVRVISNTTGDRERQVWSLQPALQTVNTLIQVFAASVPRRDRRGDPSSKDSS